MIEPESHNNNNNNARPGNSKSSTTIKTIIISFRGENLLDFHL